MPNVVDRLRTHASSDRATAAIQKTWEKHDPRARETKRAYLQRADELEKAAGKLEKLGEIARAIVAENEDGHTLSLTMRRFAGSMRQDAADQRDDSLIFYADRIEAWADYLEKLESHALEALA